MTVENGTVFVVDDDTAIRDSLSLLLRSMSLNVETFASALEFLDHCDPTRGGCLLLDIRMPGMSGLDLQEELRCRGIHLPIIFVTGHGDVSMAVRAMKRGAIDFVEKPFNDQELLDRINQAIEIDEVNRLHRDEQSRVAATIKLLSPREHEVMGRIVQGQANKVIAIDLGLSERTIEIHRSRVMAKTGARSLAQLVTMVTRLGSAQPMTKPEES